MFYILGESLNIILAYLYFYVLINLAIFWGHIVSITIKFVVRENAIGRNDWPESTWPQAEARASIEKILAMVGITTGDFTVSKSNYRKLSGSRMLLVQKSENSIFLRYYEDFDNINGCVRAIELGTTDPLINMSTVYERLKQLALDKRGEAEKKYREYREQDGARRAEQTIRWLERRKKSWQDKLARAENEIKAIDERIEALRKK